MQLLDRLSDLKGRLIAYCGGGGIVVYSKSGAAAQQMTTLAQQQQIDLMSYHLTPVVTVGNVLALVGTAVVFGRFVLDVVKFIYSRKRKNGSSAA